MMTPEESQGYVDMVLKWLPELMEDTKRDIDDNKDVADDIIQLRWKRVMSALEDSEDHIDIQMWQEMAKVIQEATDELDAYLEARDEKSDSPESYWTAEELSQFATKGA